MRSVGLVQGIRQGLLLPSSYTRRGWPLCLKCGEDVDALHIVDEGKKNGLRYVVVQVRHHGQHDAVRIDFLSAHPTQSDFDAAVLAAQFFPNEHQDSGFSAGGL